MKLETFFEKFDQFADAPDAVAKMRGLVRHIAVTGKLVPQDPNDGDARKMIDLAMERRQQTIKTKSLRRKELDESADLFKHEDLPSSWCVERFANLVDPENTISYGVLVPGNDVPDGIRFVRAQDLCLSNHPARPNKTIAPEIEKPYARTRLTGGEILLCVVGSIGKLGIVPDSWAGANIARAVARIKPIPDVLRDYLLLVLQDKSVQNYFASTTRTLAQPTLNVGMIEQTPIPVPPLAEQKRIVAKVDELMALCDRLETQQQERETRHAALARASLARFADAPTPANLDFIFHSSFSIPPSDLRKSILTLAVQGKLVPQDPNDQPAEEVLAHIAATKLRLQKTGEIGKEKPVEPLRLDSLPFEAPDSWRWAKLAELTELITKGSSPKWQGIAYVPESEGILFITSENVGNYVLRKLDDLKYVSKGFNEIEPRSILKRGDILMNLVGASIGRTAVYDLHDGANINQAVALIRLVRDTDGVCPRFLLHYLNSPSAIDYVLSSRVVNAQPNISLTDAREFAVPIPPLAEQRRIVAKVEQLMALVVALETQLAASRATAANLLSALVAELTAA